MAHAERTWLVRSVSVAVALLLCTVVLAGPLTAPAQALGARSKQFQMPSNRNAEIPKEAPKLSEIKLIDYDFKKYGSSAERRRLLDRWDTEVNSLPR